jgi:hypothetical protein
MAQAEHVIQSRKLDVQSPIHHGQPSCDDQLVSGDQHAIA